MKRSLPPFWGDEQTRRQKKARVADEGREIFDGFCSHIEEYLNTVHVSGLPWDAKQFSYEELSRTGYELVFHHRDEVIVPIVERLLRLVYGQIPRLCSRVLGLEKPTLALNQMFETLPTLLEAIFYYAVRSLPLVDYSPLYKWVTTQPNPWPAMVYRFSVKPVALAWFNAQLSARWAPGATLWDGKLILRIMSREQREAILLTLDRLLPPLELRLIIAKMVQVEWWMETRPPRPAILTLLGV